MRLGGTSAVLRPLLHPVCGAVHGGQWVLMSAVGHFWDEVASLRAQGALGTSPDSLFGGMALC